MTHALLHVLLTKAKFFAGKQASTFHLYTLFYFTIILRKLELLFLYILLKQFIWNNVYFAC